MLSVSNKFIFQIIGINTSESDCSEHSPSQSTVNLTHHGDEQEQSIDYSGCLN